MPSQQLTLLCVGLWLVRILAATNRTICFHGNGAGDRGTAVATFDYAHYAQKLYGHKSIIFFPDYVETFYKQHHGAHSSLQKFSDNFEVVIYKPRGEGTANKFGTPALMDAAVASQCDVMYIIKDGAIDHSPTPSTWRHCPQVCTVVHGVFFYQPHGDVFASIHTSIKNSNGPTKAVPHMVVPPPDVPSPTNYKEEFGIPKSALVVCRHGGATTFDIKQAHQAVIKSVGMFTSDQLHYIFLNTDHFLDAAKYPKRIHFLPSTSSSVLKEKYFQSCDAMLHARSDGETFGLAVAEFSVRNKPVLTTESGENSRTHVAILGDAAYLWQPNDGMLLKHIQSMIDNGIPEKNYNRYADYYPEPVMKQFEDIFVQPCVDILKNRLPDPKQCKVGGVIHWPLDMKRLGGV